MFAANSDIARRGHSGSIDITGRYSQRVFSSALGMEAPGRGGRAAGGCRFMVCLTALISRPLIGRGPDERGVDDNGNAIRLSAGRRALIRHGLAAG
ncbi:hypothetical protein EVAR_103631_1 [Eumeta japonica]|uniref:Uncharacterized protein n=1 Tax=Eumeta variegata TaxID=151549 RepID=A0A4C1ZJA1_EUMVA|nr:hypothetical protein EVAR_103631_1 [Eumeta japonica]